MRVQFRRSRACNGVASGQHDDQGHGTTANRFDDHSVPRANALIGERQLAVAITRGDVDAGEVKGDVGVRFAQHPREMAAQRRQILLITHAVAQRHIEVRAHLGGRIIAFAVHRESKHRVDVLENRRCPVSLVHVQVDDQGALDGRIIPQPGNRDGHVVQDTKAFAVIREGMVRTPGEIPGKPGHERRARREQCPARCHPRAQPQRLRPRQTEPPLFCRRQSRRIQFAQVLARMHEPQGLEIERFGLQQITCRQHAFAQQPVLEQHRLRGRGCGARRGVCGHGDLISRMITALHRDSMRSSDHHPSSHRPPEEQRIVDYES